MIQLEELNSKAYELVKTIFEKSESNSVKNGAIGLLDKLKLLNDTEKHTLAITDNQKEQLQTILYDKLLLKIEKATEDISSVAIENINNDIDILRKII